MEVIRAWLHSDGAQFVLGAYASASLGVVSSMLLMEAAIQKSEPKLVQWKGKSGRRELIEAARVKVPLLEQLKLTAWNIFGPLNIIASVALSLMVNRFSSFTSGSGTIVLWPPSVWVFVMHLLLLSLISDLGQYLGHLLLHRVSYLRKHVHSVHHQIQTPTAVSTGYADAMDAALQIAIPMIVAITIVPAHRFTIYSFIFMSVSNNVINHSGIDKLWLHILTLRFLPFRCPLWWHDAHHRLGNREQANNFGEIWTIWDMLGGTAISASAYHKLCEG